MARYTWILRNILPVIILLAAIAEATDNGERRRRHHAEDIDGESQVLSEHRRHATRSRSLKLSTGKSNEIIDVPGKKVSHRLIGGHFKVARPKEQQGESSEASWDDGFLLSSAGNGKERKNVKSDDDDDKKTLSQQVKEGKYGLIQNEIYPDQPKRPGIISYHDNPEVPKDNAANLGGLDEDEIWLAENHVLVLRGGKFPDHDPQNEGTSETDKPWKPIDDYQAPKRQVKIPSKPKVPPPFPIQLTDGGPIQIYGPNGTVEIDKGTLDYDNNPFYKKGQVPGEGPFFAIAPNGSLVSNGFVEPGNSDEIGKFRPPTGTPGSIYQGLPPGAVFVPPPSNQTDYDDEDQSIYYPPPYSFQYKQENSTAIPPGPLVPGIILPPPIDFFAPLDEKKSVTKKRNKRPGTGTTPTLRPRPTYLPPRKLTTKYYKTSTPETPNGVRDCRNTTCSFRFSTRKYPKSMPYLEVATTPVSVKTTTDTNSQFYPTDTVIGNQVTETSTKGKDQWTGLMNGKVPVLAYYPTTTVPSVERPVEVTPASIKNILSMSGHSPRVPSQASYYFYEEANESTDETTENPSPIYYRSTTVSPYYKLELPSSQQERRNEFYRIENIAPVRQEETSKDYNVKVLNSIAKEPQEYYGVTPKSSARAKSQQILLEKQPIYYETISDRPPITVESFQTTIKPQTYYKNAQSDGQLEYKQEKRPKAIYQYSFEATDYTKDNTQQSHNYQTPQEQRQQVVYNDYSDTASQSVNLNRNNNQILQKHRQVIYKPQRSYVNPTATTTTSSTDTSVDVTTENPQNAYFTQQDEKLLDAITKEYFTMFGKKLKGKGLPSTTPIYGKSNSVTERPNYAKNEKNFNVYSPKDYNYNNNNNRHQGIYKLPNVKVDYGDMPRQRTYSLEGDTLVNYKDPLPTINPDSEFIEIVKPNRPGQQQHQRPLNNYNIQHDAIPIANHPEDFRFHQIRQNERFQPIRVYDNPHNYKQPEKPLNDYVPVNNPSIEEFRPRPPSLVDDIAVNYRDPLAAINPDAEFIDPTVVDDRSELAEYFAYRLPGDGGHFYFLTPQAATPRRDDRAGNYPYQKRHNSRLLRRRRGPANV